MRTLPSLAHALRRLLPALLIAVSISGCGAVPYRQYRTAQMQALQLHQKNRMLASQLGQSQQMAAQLQAEKLQLEMAANQLNGSLQIANERLTNFSNERGQLHEKYKGLLTGLPAPGGQLPSSAIERLRALAEKYPEFEFDPVAGVAKFHGSLLFATGSDALRPESHRLLNEFSQIMNDPVARSFNVLVVGHTDDVRIAKDATRAKHPTNWDLSAHRATAVVRQLAASGVEEPRMGIAGYSMFQPAAANTDERSRQQNRRVEIYVLAPEASLASAGRFPQ